MPSESESTQGSYKGKPHVHNNHGEAATQYLYVQDPNYANQAAPQRVVIIVAEPVEFEDMGTKHRFITRVYLLLLLQILITAVLTAIFYFVKPVKDFMSDHPWLFYVLVAVTIVMFIIIGCCDTIRRTVPLNFFCLFFCNIVVGMLLGVICAAYSVPSILVATVITFVVFTGLTVFACQTRCDMTMLREMILAFTLCTLCLAISILLFSFVWVFFPWLELVYAGLVATILCLYIVYDTQLVVHGRHRQSITSDEYIYASFNLYVDVVFLFCLVLGCSGGRE